MRTRSRRYLAMLSHPVRWRTLVDWSNNGGQTWAPCTYLGGGKVTADQTSQVRWSTSLRILGPELGRDGLNPFTSRIRIRHGMAGEPLMAMGRYLVTGAGWSEEWPDALEVVGKSHEVYVQQARFRTARTFRPQSARQLLELLIREVLPRAQVSWQNVDADMLLPKITELRDRWAIIDGGPDATSIAKALGAMVHTGPSGEWVVAPVPTLQDDPVWEAAEGEDGVLLKHSEQLSREGVYNVMVVSGQSMSGDGPPFKPGVSADTDPLSPTYVGRSADDGGFGECPRFYTSPLIRSTLAAENTARAMLAPYLGLKQQIEFSQLHDPTIEPGDVGLVHTRKGLRRVLLDAVTYDLDGGPLSGQTRTTATRLAGTSTEQPDDQGGE